MIRKKTTKSGGLLEIDFYPTFDNGHRMPTRKKKEKRSSEQQQTYNRRCAVKKFIRLINLNFTPNDFYMHPTYDTAHAPKNKEQAEKDIKNYLRRVKRKRESILKEVQTEIKEIQGELKQFDSKHLKLRLKELKKRRRLLKKPFKYAYGIEKARLWHFHLFVTGGLDYKVMENLWYQGVRVKCANYDPMMFGYEKAAAYMLKDPKGSKSFVCSRNMVKPSDRHIKTKDGEFTRAGLARMAQGNAFSAEYWERRYKGYRFVRVYSRYNSFNGHWYVSAVMYKTDTDPPKFDVDPAEWLPEDMDGDFIYYTKEDFENENQEN